MIVTKEDIMNLIFHKCFYGGAIGETKSKVVSLFGEPIHFQPQRKKIKRYYYMMELISIYIIQLLWKLVLIFQNHHRLN